jgi:hypothetical protein
VDTQGSGADACERGTGLPSLHPARQRRLHFFSASPSECTSARTLHPEYILETSAAFYASLPDRASGACLYNQKPVYRLWNWARGFESPLYDIACDSRFDVE